MNNSPFWSVVAVLGTVAVAFGNAADSVGDETVGLSEHDSEELEGSPNLLIKEDGTVIVRQEVGDDHGLIPPWQTFIAPITGMISVIELKPNTFLGIAGKLSVYEGAGIRGKRLHQQDYAVDEQRGFPWSPFELTTPLAVEEGKMYTWEFTGGRGLLHAKTDRYPDGAAGGGPRDHCFRIHFVKTLESVSGRRVVDTQDETVGLSERDSEETKGSPNLLIKEDGTVIVRQEVGDDHLLIAPWQTFKAPITGTISVIELMPNTYLGISGKLSVYEGAGIRGKRLHQQDYAIDDNRGGFRWIPFELTTPLAVDEGKTYTWEFTGAKGLKRAKTDRYADGGAAGGTCDHCFRIYFVKTLESASGEAVVDTQSEQTQNDVLRTWTDDTGTFRTEAVLLDFKDGLVSLRKKGGQVVRLRIERLSTADQEYVRKQTAASVAGHESASGAKHAQPERARPAGSSEIPAQTLRRLKAATVFVKVTAGRLESSGSGFLLKKEGNIGYVVSNAHVVSSPVPAPVTVRCVFDSGSAAERSVPATVLGQDEERDLAILKVSLDGLPEPVDLTGKTAITETLPVFVLGFPFGEALRTSQRQPSITISRASISSIRRDASDRIVVIQVDGDINPGNSGGPIVDARGRLIGIAVATVVGTQIGMAIPVEELSAMLNGRVAASQINARKVKNGVASVTATARLIDPLGKIESVSLYYICKTDLREPVKPDSRTTWQRLPNARRVPLTVDGGMADGEFKIQAQDITDGEYVFQIAYFDGAGKSVNLSPGEFRVPQSEMDERVANTRKQPNAGRSELGSPGGASGRKPVTEFSWDRPLTNVVESPLEHAVQGSVERDSNGHPYMALSSKGVTLELGKDLLQIVACPTGKVVYVIQRGEPVVTVVDPLTWKPISEILVPESPTSIWADPMLIGVACNKSKVVAIIDAQKRSLIASGSSDELSGYTPDTIVGRAPDGSLMSLWQQDDGSGRDRALVHLSPQGKSQIVINGQRMYWATWLRDRTGVVAQGSFSGSPSGSFDLAFPRGPKQFSELHNSRLFGGGAPFHCDTCPAFLTSDRKALVFSRTRVAPERWRDSTGYRPDDSIDERRGGKSNAPWTYLISPSVDKILGEFPGYAVVELPEQRLFVTVGLTAEGIWTCYYVSSADGKIVREITLQWPKSIPHRGAPRTYGPHARPIFVPGHELLLMPSTNRRQLNVSLAYTAFRCGPLKNGDLQLRASPVPVNDPPSTARAGEEIRYAPVLESGVSASAFRLKRAAPGMTIDPETGSFVWRPEKQHVGRWTITILATVAGEETTVITWTVTVR